MCNVHACVYASTTALPLVPSTHAGTLPCVAHSHQIARKNPLAGGRDAPRVMPGVGVCCRGRERELWPFLVALVVPLLLVTSQVDVMRHEFCLEWMQDFEAYSAALEKDATYAATLSRSLSLVLDEFYRWACVGSACHRACVGSACHHACVWSTCHHAWLHRLSH